MKFFAIFALIAVAGASQVELEKGPKKAAKACYQAKSNSGLCPSDPKNTDKCTKKSKKSSW